jgi:hypothetical protein
MQTREITITIETAKRWYNGEDKELKELAIQTFPELSVKQLPKKWEDLMPINGFYINVNSELKGFFSDRNKIYCQNLFKTQRQAESAIAMAKLSQVMAVYNDGWEPDWNNFFQEKWCVRLDKEKLKIDIFISLKMFLVFKTQELAKEFLENFREDIETFYNY